MPKDLGSIEQAYSAITAFLVAYSFQILASLAILVIGWKLSGWMGRRVAAFARRKGVEATLAGLIGDSSRVVALGFVIIITLGNFGIAIAPLIAAAGAAALGLTVAIQGPLSNFAAGLVIILTRPFVVGNTITVRGVSGVVQEIKLGATMLKNADGADVIVPNRQIVGEILVNSRENQIAETRAHLAYDAPVAQALEIVGRAVASVPGVAATPAPEIGVFDLGDHGPVVIARYWIPSRDYFPTRFAVNRAVLDSLAAEGIALQPIPIAPSR